VPLTPKRDVRVVEAAMADLLQRPGEVVGPKDDYLLIRLLDEGVVLDAMNRLRPELPNLLHVERARAPGLPGDAAGGASRGAGRRDQPPEDLFADFWREVTEDTGLPEAAAEELSETIAALRAAEREEVGS
jgi:exonuclease SbcD